MKKKHFNKNFTLGLVIVVISILSLSEANCQLKKVWETPSIFLSPESVAYDSVHNCIYVSNFNDKGGFRKKEDTVYNECISKIDLLGNLQEIRWIDSLLGPTGIAVFNDKLYIVERRDLCIVNIEKGEIEKRIPVKGAGFMNDIVIDKQGVVYISDSNNDCIYKIENGKSEIWYSDTLMKSPNGLFLDKNNILIGNRGESTLISVSLSDKTSKTISRSLSVNIDGIKKYNSQYFLSWNSKLFSLEQGTKKILFESDNEKEFLADFDLIKDKNLIIIPWLISNKITAFKLE